MTNPTVPEENSQISIAWNIISELIVGMKISDPKWQAATTWLNANRKHQVVIPRLPVNAKIP